MISFYGAGPSTRTTHVFIALASDPNGARPSVSEVPFGIIDETGLQIIAAFNDEYKDLKDLAMWPSVKEGSAAKGYEALLKTHPNIDYLQKCKLVQAKETGMMDYLWAIPARAHGDQVADNIFPRFIMLVTAIVLLYVPFKRWQGPITMDRIIYRIRP